MLGAAAGGVVGVVLGTISGLGPGVHSNTVAGFLEGASGPMLVLFGQEGLVAAIVATMVTHTFLDAVPSTFLGVPDPDTVLSVLPAHRLCLAGHGEEAVRVSALGSVAGFVLCLPLFVVFMLVLPPMQGYIDWGIGVPVLLLSMRSTAEVTPQRFSGLLIGSREMVWSGLRGAVAGAIVGWLPGFSSGTANALRAIRRDGDFERTDARGDLVATSAVNTANAVLGIAALYAVGRMRRGAMVALGSLELPPLSFVVLVAAVAALCGYGLTIAASRSAPVLIRVNQWVLARGVLVFLVVVSFVFCGPFGLLILAAATLVGMTPGLLDVSRIYTVRPHRSLDDVRGRLRTPKEVFWKRAEEHITKNCNYLFNKQLAEEST